MNYQGVIFDLDGVLCTTDQLHYRAWKGVADKLGVYFDEKVNNRLRGVSRMQSLEIILEGYRGALTDEKKLALATEKNEAYRKLLMTLTPKDIGQGVLPVLNTLREKSVKMAIGSSSKNTPLILQRLGLDTFFDAISDGNSITHSKPHPEVFLNAAKLLGLKPDYCLVVEDAIAGVEAAQAGGFDSAGMGEAATDARCTHPLTSFSQLEQVVLG